MKEFVWNVFLAYDAGQIGCYTPVPDITIDLFCKDVRTF